MTARPTLGLADEIHKALKRRWDNIDLPEPTLEDEAYTAAAAALVFLRARWGVDKIERERQDAIEALDHVCREVFVRLEFDAWTFPQVRRVLGKERVREIRTAMHDAAATSNAEGFYGTGDVA